MSRPLQLLIKNNSSFLSSAVSFRVRTSANGTRAIFRYDSKRQLQFKSHRVCQLMDLAHIIHAPLPRLLAQGNRGVWDIAVF